MILKMRGGVQLTICLIFTAIFKDIHTLRCDREPVGSTSPKSDVDNRFLIKISGNPDKYVPGEVYAVSLQGERIQQFTQKFTGFMLVVEPSNEYLPSWVEGVSRGLTALHDYGNRNVGTFTLFENALAKFSDRCPNAVIQTSSLPKSEIQVLWTAPPQGSGCIVFRATVVESRDFWYKDDGPLSRLLCEDVQENDDIQPEVVNPCCACDEAKYEVTFEGLWSRHTHPKDFPTNGWLTRFSDVIGASHSANYRFWDYGSSASEGLRQVAERGATRMLESELKAKSEHIRTIIKARGISFPNVTGKTFAVFRVDRKHHLMSIVSMIDPSPDWIVGVSRLELCLRNCSWVEHKVLNLYPWDAGTDSGITYISPDMPTTPRETIRRITSSYPNDPRSPFYDPSGTEMKPLARLYLTRQRLYEKSCSDDSLSSATEEEFGSEEHTPSGDCEVSEWGQWSACSVTCGKGVKLKQRGYVHTMGPQMKSCNVQLTARSSCYGAQKTCSIQGNVELTDLPLDPICAVTKWSLWSDCSVSCGRGVRTRTRIFESQQGHKHCSHLPNAPVLQQNDKCNGVEGTTCRDSFEDSQEEKGNCPLTKWSEWSPCSASCGKGKRIRTRLLVVYNEHTRKIYQHMDEGHVPLSIEDCADVQTTEEVDCNSEITSCEITPSMAREICQMPKEKGVCSGNNSRWYFDTNMESCQEFSYSGCRGNKNNFLTQEHCETTCRGYKDEEEGDDMYTTMGPVNSELPHLSLIRGDSDITTLPKPVDGDDDYNTTDEEQDIDCVTSHWSSWSVCSASCGRGYKTKTRTIKVHPKNGGKPCPKKLTKKKKCRGRTCNGNGMADEYPTWGPANLQHGERTVDCVLSEWTSWSPCSLTCGMNAVRQRTRSVIRSNSGGGMPCGLRLEVSPCELLPCND